MSRYRLGTAHNGLHDWYLQRVSAVVLALLLPPAFLLLLCLYHGNIDYAAFWSFQHHAGVRALNSLLATALAVHLYTGLKVIIEDYLHAPCLRALLSGGLAILTTTVLLWWLSVIWKWTM